MIVKTGQTHDGSDFSIFGIYSVNILEIDKIFIVFSFPVLFLHVIFLHSILK